MPEAEQGEKKVPNEGDLGDQQAANSGADCKWAEEEIARLNDALAARDAELEVANQDLEAFSYVAAHELLQPLNLISLNCLSIKLFCCDDPAECVKYIEDVHSSTERMSRSICRLLNFSRVGRVELRRETVDLSALAREVAGLLKSSEPQRQVHFSIPDGIAAHVDPTLARMVLENLLGNALKYSSAQEIAFIEFGATPIDGVITCFVRDNGIGFDTNETGELFSAFKRQRGAAQGKGAGIGLPTVERIIRRHGGKIWAEGTRDQGATFYFTLEAGQA